MPGVLAVGAGLAPEAGREAGVAQRQGRRVEQLVAVVGDQQDLGGAGQVQVVVGGAEDLLLVGGQEPGPEHRLPPDQHRRDHGHEPGRRQPFHGEADQGELEQRPRPDQVAEAGPGHLGRPDGVDRAQQLAQLQVVADGEVEVPRGADPAQLDRVLLAAGRDGRVGRVGHAGLDLGQGGVGGAQAVLGLVEAVRQLLEAGQDPLALVRGGLGDLPAAALLLGPQGLDLGDQAAAVGVGLQQPVDLVGGAGAALGQGRLDPLGVVTHELQIQHAPRLPDRRHRIR